ncbi:ZIP family metal transporter [Acidimicrobiaceae bacterium AH-315-P05]|nr:ZIP family metal transporter [Acidimicrobiaceae bacterium AH-315-P05]
MTGVAAGLLLASAILVVIPEGFEVAASAASDSQAFVYEPVVLGAAVLAGFLAMLSLEGLGIGHDIHEEHHDHAEGHGHGHVHHPTSATSLVLGLSAHAVADGLAIGSAAAASDTAFSVVVAIAVLIHRVPAAFSLGVFTLHENQTPTRALQSVVAFAAATPVAMLASFVLLDGADVGVIALALLFAAGTFVYVATVDTLPAVHNTELGRRSMRNVLLGAAIFAVVLWLAGLGGLLEHSQ